MSISPDRNGASRVQIGIIVGAHGIQGAIRVHPTTDYPERFTDMKTLLVEHSSKPPVELEVRGIKFHEGKGQILVTAEGINDRDAAEALKGRVITVAPDERVNLPEGEYWIDSLVGLDVIDDGSGKHLGKLEEVISTGGNDVYLIRAEDGAQKLIPAIEDVIRVIALEKNEMRINVLEGLWD
ncbi:MAG: ribosome maturation factor RimM [Synergistaceae bacterium]|nr:ribosome maturation factor RimM [Synergistaceae bacterium]